MEPDGLASLVTAPDPGSVACATVAAPLPLSEDPGPEKGLDAPPEVAAVIALDSLLPLVPEPDPVPAVLPDPVPVPDPVPAVEPLPEPVPDVAPVPLPDPPLEATVSPPPDP